MTARTVDLVIRGGTIVMPEGAYAASIAVQDGIIAAKINEALQYQFRPLPTTDDGPPFVAGDDSWDFVAEDVEESDADTDEEFDPEECNPHSALIRQLARMPKALKTLSAETLRQINQDLWRAAQP